MRIGRATIVPAIVALGAAGAILAGSAASVTAATAPSTHVSSTVSAMSPDTLYNG
jgi:fructose-1-phosphate kinase PfkB-like protein